MKLHSLRWPLFAGFGLGIFAWSAAPSVTGGDAGELLNASWTLGIAHPPGYPLYTLLGWLFARLVVVGEVAWRYNLFSAACTLAAGILMGRLVERITRDFWAGLLTAALCCFSPLMWRYSVVAEVFGLNQLLVAAFLSLLWSHLEKGDARSWATLCFVAGLSMSHHHTSVFITGPSLLYLLWQERAEFPRRLGTALASGMAGLIPYVYLWIAAQQVPLMAWGNTSTWQGALLHFLRQEYGTFQLGNELTGHANAVFLRLGYFARELPMNSLLGLGLVWGFQFFKSRGRSAQLVTFGRLTAATCSFYLVLFCYLANLSLDKPLGLAVQSRFWLLGLLFFCLWAGLGFGLNPSAVWTRHRRTIAATATALLVVFGLATESQRKTSQFRDYARAVLESLPQGSVLFFEGDHAFGALYYAQKVLGVREDLRILHLNFLSRPWSRRWAQANYPDITLPARGSGVYGSDGYSIRDLVDANRRQGREIFVLNAIRGWDTSLEGHSRRVPWGMANWLVSESVPPSEAFAIWSEGSRRFFNSFETPWSPGQKLGDVPGQTWEEVLNAEYMDARHNYAVALANYVQGGLAGERAASLSREGLQVLDSIRPLYGEAKPAFWKNYGLLQYQLMPWEPARRQEISRQVIESWSRYLRDKTDPDPQQPTMEQIMRALRG